MLQFLKQPIYSFSCFSYLFVLLESRDGLHLSRVGNKVVFEEVTKTLKGEGIGAEDLVVDLPLIEDVDPKQPLRAFDEF